MQRLEATLPRVVVLATYCSACHSSTAVSPLAVAGACGTNNLSSNSLIVPISWLIIPIASSSYSWRLFIWTASILFGSATFSFLSLLRASELEAGGNVELLAGWFCGRAFRGILWLLNISERMI